MTSRIPGIIRTSSATTSADWLSPQASRKRAREYAAIVPIVRLTATDTATTKTLFVRYDPKWYVSKRRA